MASQEHLQNRRKEILSAAEKVFDASGYSSATMEAVAVEAGIAKGSLYNYFRSKKDLFIQVFIEANSGARAQLERAVASQNLSAGETILSMLDEWFAMLPYNQKISRLVMEFWAIAAREDADGRFMALFRESNQGWHRMAVSILADGVRRGEFDANLDVQSAATLIISVLKGVQFFAMMDVGLNVDAHLLGEIKKAILSGLILGEEDLKNKIAHTGMAMPAVPMRGMRL